MVLGKVFLLGGKRTPFGSFGGSLKDIKPVDLAVLSSKAALEDLKLAADSIDHTIFANVVPSTSDTLYGARHVGLKVGAPIEKGGFNVNRLCGSGIEAVLVAKRMILCVTKSQRAVTMSFNKTAHWKSWDKDLTIYYWK